MIMQQAPHLLRPILPAHRPSYQQVQQQAHRPKHKRENEAGNQHDMPYTMFGRIGSYVYTC